MWAFFSKRRFDANYQSLRNTIRILIFLILGLSFFVTNAFPLDQKPIPAREEVKELVMTPEQMRDYASCYKDPYVLHIRKVINNYLTKKLEGNDNYEALEGVDLEYLKNKFVVAAVEGALMGGRQIVLISQAKPDKMFYVWVYYKGGDTYELRAFDIVELSDEEIKDIRIMYRRFLQDKNLAL